MSISKVSLSRGVYEKKYIIFQYVEFDTFKEALYSGTMVDDIHIAYIFADILYLALIHIIQNKVTSRIKLFKT